MEPFFISTFSIASAEIGDKTQLLTLLFATRFNKPAPIILGILLATLLNHTLAALFGKWLSIHFSTATLHGILAIAFIVAAFWLLIPDRLGSSKQKDNYTISIFITTLIGFFFAEIGDKTQIATMLMAAQFQTMIPVILGTTIGMLLVNVPVVFLGSKATEYISLKFVRCISSGIFLLLAIWELIKLFD